MIGSLFYRKCRNKICEPNFGTSDAIMNHTVDFGNTEEGKRRALQSEMLMWLVER